MNNTQKQIANDIASSLLELDIADSINALELLEVEMKASSERMNGITSSLGALFMSLKTSLFA